MHGSLKMTIAIVGGFTLGAGAIQALHAQNRRSSTRTAENHGWSSMAG
jgi:enoyl-CoA hydratase/carnithine racemase